MTLNISTETAIVISTLLGSLTVCLVKIIHTLQESKCKEIEMCCLSCKREVSLETSKNDEVITFENLPNTLSNTIPNTLPKVLPKV